MMVPLSSDQGIFVDKTDGPLPVLSALYVDHLLRNGNKAFRKKCKATTKKFNAKVKAQLPIKFTGFNIERSAKGTLY